MNPNKIQQVIMIAVLYCLFTGCGGSETRRTKPEHHPAPTPVSADSGIEIVKIVQPLSVSEDAIQPLTSRGDAFWAEDKIVFRGATSGLLVGEIDETTSHFRELASISLPGSVNDIIVHKNVAFLACGPYGVALVDISSPKQPVHLATIDTQGAALRLAIDRNTLVIADGAMGLVVADVKNPVDPVVIALWPSTGYVRDVAIKKRHILVAEDRAGVSMLKLSLKGEISTQWKFSTGGQARSLNWGRKNKLYVANGSHGIIVLDISGRKKPEELGRLILKDMSRDIATNKKGSRAYVANGDAGIFVIDISNPGAMKVTGNYSPDTPANRVYPMEKVLYVGSDSGGLLLLDIENPDTPAKL